MQLYQLCCEGSFAQTAAPGFWQVAWVSATVISNSYYWYSHCGCQLEQHHNYALQCMENFEVRVLYVVTIADVIHS